MVCYKGINRCIVPAVDWMDDPVRTSAAAMTSDVEVDPGDAANVVDLVVDSAAAAAVVGAVVADAGYSDEDAVDFVAVDNVADSDVVDSDTADVEVKDAVHIPVDFHTPMAVVHTPAEDLNPIEVHNIPRWMVDNYNYYVDPTEAASHKNTVLADTPVGVPGTLSRFLADTQVVPADNVLVHYHYHSNMFLQNYLLVHS